MKFNPERLLVAGMAASAVVVTGVLVFAVVGTVSGGSGSAPSPTRFAAVSPSFTPTPEITPSPTPSPAISPTASTNPLAPPLPAMLAAIGDSYTQAWSVSPEFKKDHPQFSWAVGTDATDGVYSLRERFEALGAKPVVVDAATSGMKMDDAVRQANLIVTEAAKLPAGSTVFVTFALGTNDLCDDPMTDPGAFDGQLSAALNVLRGGLPPGSRILMLPVPDFVHFYQITQASPAALARLSEPAQSANCAPFLGSKTTSTLAQSTAMLTRYDSVLAAACAGIEATEGPYDRLHCRYDGLRLAEKDFVLADLSTVDYFHPSLSGQAKIAAAAWQAGYWAKLPLPAH